MVAMNSRSREENRLADEKSPYLQQHADNPVNWYPWGEEAFERAGEENLPIFLSIGYSTCHWCHVMEEESFQDEKAAEVLNENFVSIKVDREERPDVDSFYMDVCQAITGRGGWPLTIIMTPDKKPFFARTYLPRETLIDILQQIARYWQNDRGELIHRGEQIVKALTEAGGDVGKKFAGAESPGQQEMEEELADILEKTARGLRKSFDDRYGGFGQAPKFPQPQNLLFLLRYHHHTGGKSYLQMVRRTLDNMARGGIYDQVGFGFSRYSTDRRWLVPHFEKMLYDNALLAQVYLEAHQVTGSDDYARTAGEILEYMERDLLSPEGAFYTAEDADVEGEEGRYYLWDKEEIIDLLGEERGEQFCRCFNIDEEGNFSGSNIPNLIEGENEEECSAPGRAEIWQKWQDELIELFQARQRRKRPFLDDKILTGWNGLAIAAFARAYRVLGDDRYGEIAREAVEFIEEKLTDGEGRLLARYREGGSSLRGYARDYAFYIRGLLEMYRATLEPYYLERARHYNQELVEKYYDEEAGGLFHLPPEISELPRPEKDIRDGALPSATSLALYNWFELSLFTDADDLRELISADIKKQLNLYREEGLNFTGALSAVLAYHSGGEEVVIIAPENGEKASFVTDQLKPLYLPFTGLLLLTEASRNMLKELNEFAAARKSKDNRWTAHICENGVCRRPLEDLDELLKALK